MILPTFKYAGGIESFFMNNLKNLANEGITFDVLTHEISAMQYVEEVEKRGGVVSKLPQFTVRNLREIARLYRGVLNRKRYDIVHCNMANASFLYLRIAKQLGVPVRIQHSHQDKAADTFVHAMRNIPLLRLGNQYANEYVACSPNAGFFLFGNKPFDVLRNTIDYEAFRFDQQVRDDYREKLCIKDSEYVIGHTGRLTSQKNQLFLLDVIEEVLKMKPNARLVLVGDGEDQAKIETVIKKKNLEGKVDLLGERDDINKILQAMDLFLFPSLYEGLGISLLEAEAAGLQCICSNAVPIDAKIVDSLCYLSLESGPKEWAKAIVNGVHDVDRTHVNLDKKYDVKQNKMALKQLYINYLEKNK